MKINRLRVIVCAMGLFASLSIKTVAFADLKSAESAYARHDYGAAFKEFQTLAHQGNAEALYQVGVIYLYGQGTARNYSGAMYCLRQAAKKGWPAANTEIGSIYMNGYGVTQDYTQAFHWFRIAASAGDAEGMYMLGTLYQIGRGGIPVNHDQALFWRQQAALKGYPDNTKVLQAIDASNKTRQAVLQRLSSDQERPNVQNLVNPYNYKAMEVLAIAMFFVICAIGLILMHASRFKSDSNQNSSAIETSINPQNISSQTNPSIIEEFNRRKFLRLKLLCLAIGGYVIATATVMLSVTIFHLHLDPVFAGVVPLLLVMGL